MGAKSNRPVNLTKRKVRGTFTYGLDGSVKYTHKKQTKKKG